MKIIGAIQAFQEEDKIGGAVDALFAAGCDRVVVLDGAWLLPDGTPFGGGDVTSTDRTVDQAEAAGATVAYCLTPMYGDGGKRHALIRSLGAHPGDRVLILDADERIEGRIDRDSIPDGHAAVMLRNIRENDLPGIRGTFPHGDYGPRVPLIRWLLWSDQLRCDGPGRYADGSGPIQVYVDQIGDDVDPEHACALPILSGLQILHIVQPSPERVAEKVRYYEAMTAA